MLIRFFETQRAIVFCIVFKRQSTCSFKFFDIDVDFNDEMKLSRFVNSSLYLSKSILSHTYVILIVVSIIVRFRKIFIKK